MKFYKLNQISLEPDKYGNHIKIKMVTAIDKDGKYIKHEKINDDMLNILKNGFFLPHKPEGE